MFYKATELCTARTRIQFKLFAFVLGTNSTTIPALRASDFILVNLKPLTTRERILETLFQEPLVYS